MVFGEDQSRARTGHAAENLAATRRVAIDLLRQDKENKRSLKSQRLRATLDPNARPLLASQDASALAQGRRIKRRR